MHHPISRSVKIGALCLGILPSLAPAAWVHFDPSDTSKVPKRFSQTGFYSNMAAKTVTAEAAFFDVNSPLWSDAAGKKRWVLLKPGSSKIQFDPAEDYLGYPDGTVFVKLFTHDTVPGDTTTRIYWETRLLINKKTPDTVTTEPLKVEMRDKWYPFSYKWKRDGSEAFLVGSRKGLDTILTLTVNGQKKIRKWVFPSASGCNACHRGFESGIQGRAVLGFFAPQLNRPVAGNPSMNQIRDLFAKNILGWSRAGAPSEAEIQAMAKWARLNDTTASLDLRARSYIAANCSGCHGARGMGTGAIGHVAVTYDFHKLEGNALKPDMELRDYGSATWDLEPITRPDGSVVEPKLVVAGYPGLSVLLHRMKLRNEAVPTGDPEDTAFAPLIVQMPPLGVFEVDTAAIRVVTEWITKMPALPSSLRRPLAGHEAAGPRVQGDRILLPAGLEGRASLTGLDGRRHELTEAQGGAYRIRRGLPAGVYLLKVGVRTFKLML